MKGFYGFAIGLAAISAGVIFSAPAGAQADSAFGHWSTPSKHGVVDVAPCGAGVCGHLVSSDAIRADAEARDVHNADAAQRGRPLKGVSMLAGFTRGDNAWTGGTIYNPEDGRTYKATITMADANTLNLKGCIVWPACKTQEWHRTH